MKNKSLDRGGYDRENQLEHGYQKEKLMLKQEKTFANAFTLIELLVVTSQLCRDFFKRFICTDKYGCVRKHTENAALKNTPLFSYERPFVKLYLPKNRKILR